MTAFHTKLIRAQSVFAHWMLPGKVTLLFLGGIALSACSTSPDNMQEGGLFSTLQGIHNGSYDKQIAEKESQLASLQTQQRKQQQQTAAVQTESAQTQMQIDQLQTDLKAVQSRIQNLNAENAKLAAQLQTTKQQKQKERQAIAQLNRQAIPMPAKQAEDMAALLAKRDQLRKELSLLLK